MKKRTRRKAAFLICLLFTASLVMPGFPFVQGKMADKKTEYYNLSYDTLSKSQKLDLYLPKTGTGPFPLIVFIHGGGWYSGDKKDGQEAAWVTLRSQGYAVASLNYRLSGESPHPAGIIDCKTAVRYLKANASRFKIDKKRIAVAGDSSGGHYALMLALTKGNRNFEDLSRGYSKQNSDVNCAVAWYPATDLAETMRTVQDGEYTGFGAEFAWDNIEGYVGRRIKDVADQCLVEASPITYITKNMPPVLLQHGDIDDICPIDQSRRFYQKAVKIVGKNKVSFDIIKNADHGDSKFDTKKNMKHIRKFLDKKLNVRN